MSNQLIEAQRYEIYLGLKRKWSKTRIANEIGVSKSTVSREIKRNSKQDGEYTFGVLRKQSAILANMVLKATIASRLNCGGE